MKIMSIKDRWHWAFRGWQGIIGECWESYEVESGYLRGLNGGFTLQACGVVSVYILPSGHINVNTYLTWTFRRDQCDSCNYITIRVPLSLGWSSPSS